MSVTVTKDMAMNIALRRHALGLSRYELAHALGYATACPIECAERGPWPHRLERSYNLPRILRIHNAHLLSCPHHQFIQGVAAEDAERERLRIARTIRRHRRRGFFARVARWLTNFAERN